jgi:hypothetical protein
MFYLLTPTFRRVAHSLGTVPWLRQLGASLSLFRPRFNARPNHVRYVVDKVEVRYVYLSILQVYQ